MNMKSRHIPQRTCIACQQGKDKKDLIRLVRTENGVVELDLSGRKPGRGAYLCAKRECWKEGLKGSRLEHALRIKITAENRQALINYGNSLGSEG
jgi:hypothetical protein